MINMLSRLSIALVGALTYPVFAADFIAEPLGTEVIRIQIAQAAGGGTIRLPLFAGATEAMARDMLKDAGHTGKITVFATSKTVKCPDGKHYYAPGIVCATKPDYLAVRDLATDAEIALLIQGERDLDDPYGIPPKVTGMRRTEAVKLLAEHRFTRVSYQFLEDGKCPADRVCRLGGQRLDGSWDSKDAFPRRIGILSLEVGTSHPRRLTDLNTEMISIIGDTVDEALEKLDKFGVRGSIGEDFNFPCTEETMYLGQGRICNQLPEVGTPTKGLAVRYRLSKQSKPVVPKQSADDSPFAEETKTRPNDK